MSGTLLRGGAEGAGAEAGGGDGSGGSSNSATDGDDLFDPDDDDLPYCRVRSSRN